MKKWRVSVCLWLCMLQMVPSLHALAPSSTVKDRTQSLKKLTLALREFEDFQKNSGLRWNQPKKPLLEAMQSAAREFWDNSGVQIRVDIKNRALVFYPGAPEQGGQVVLLCAEEAGFNKDKEILGQGANAVASGDIPGKIVYALRAYDVPPQAGAGAQALSGPSGKAEASLSVVEKLALQFLKSRAADLQPLLKIKALQEAASEQTKEALFWQHGNLLLTRKNIPVGSKSVYLQPEVWEGLQKLASRKASHIREFSSMKKEEIQAFAWALYVRSRLDFQEDAALAGNEPMRKHLENEPERVRLSVVGLVMRELPKILRARKLDWLGLEPMTVRLLPSPKGEDMLHYSVAFYPDNPDFRTSPKMAIGVPLADLEAEKISLDPLDKEIERRMMQLIEFRENNQALTQRYLTILRHGEEGGLQGLRARLEAADFIGQAAPLSAIPELIDLVWEEKSALVRQAMAYAILAILPYDRPLPDSLRKQVEKLKGYAGLSSLFSERAREHVKTATGYLLTGGRAPAEWVQGIRSAFSEVMENARDQADRSETCLRVLDPATHEKRFSEQERVEAAGWLEKTAPLEALPQIMDALISHHKRLTMKVASERFKKLISKKDDAALLSSGEADKADKADAVNMAALLTKRPDPEDAIIRQMKPMIESLTAATVRLGQFAKRLQPEIKKRARALAKVLYNVETLPHGTPMREQLSAFLQITDREGVFEDMMNAMVRGEDPIVPHYSKFKLRWALMPMVVSFVADTRNPTPKMERDFLQMIEVLQEPYDPKEMDTDITARLREGIARQVALVRDKTAQTILIAMLQDAMPGVRREAARQLREHHDGQETIDALEKHLATETDAEVRGFVLDALTFLRKQVARPREEILSEHVEELVAATESEQPLDQEQTAKICALLRNLTRYVTADTADNTAHFLASMLENSSSDIRMSALRELSNLIENDAFRKKVDAQAIKTALEGWLVDVEGRTVLDDGQLVGGTMKPLKEYGDWIFFLGRILDDVGDEWTIRCIDVALTGINPSRQDHVHELEVTRLNIRKRMDKIEGDMASLQQAFEDWRRKNRDMAGHAAALHLWELIEENGKDTAQFYAELYKRLFVLSQPDSQDRSNLLKAMDAVRHRSYTYEEVAYKYGVDVMALRIAFEPQAALIRVQSFDDVKRFVERNI